MLSYSTLGQIIDANHFSLLLSLCIQFETDFEVLLVLWSKHDLPAFHLVELFSGQGNVSAAFKECGFTVGSYDMITGGKAMNILSDAGFAPLP